MDSSTTFGVSNYNNLYILVKPDSVSTGSVDFDVKYSDDETAFYVIIIIIVICSVCGLILLIGIPIVVIGIIRHKKMQEIRQKNAAAAATVSAPQGIGYAQSTPQPTDMYIGGHNRDNTQIYKQLRHLCSKLWTSSNGLIATPARNFLQPASLLHPECRTSYGTSS